MTCQELSRPRLAMADCHCRILESPTIATLKSLAVSAKSQRTASGSSWFCSHPYWYAGGMSPRASSSLGMNHATSAIEAIVPGTDPLRAGPARSRARAPGALALTRGTCGSGPVTSSAASTAVATTSSRFTSNDQRCSGTLRHLIIDGFPASLARLVHHGNQPAGQIRGEAAHVGIGQVRGLTVDEHVADHRHTRVSGADEFVHVHRVHLLELVGSGLLLRRGRPGDPVVPVEGASRQIVR